MRDGWSVDIALIVLTIIPVVYLRRGGRLVEHSLPRHPLHTFGTGEHRQQVAASLAALLPRKASTSRG